jgi:CubicO group peptidase (beta-lactamase class C family)
MPRYLFLALLLALLLAPSARAQQGLLAERVKPFVDNQTLAGAVMLVANKEKVIAVETVGYADIEAKKPMKPDTTFWIASMSKPITGAALMILVDEGKVSLDDPVEKVLPEFKTMWLPVEQDQDRLVLQRQKPITVRQIMSHTSGLAFSSPLEAPTLDGLLLRDAVKSYTLIPLHSEPGTKYEYSNAGINTGGRIIEKVSGMPYEDFLQKRLFEPLGMQDTTFWPSEQQVARLATPYKPKTKEAGLEPTTISQLQYPLSSRHNRFPMPGGGLFSTADDLSRFCRMVASGGTFAGHRILSEEAIKQMTSKQTPDNLKDGYGVGWSTDGKSFGHGGALATNMNIDSTRGLITIWLVQHQGFPGDGGKAHGVFKQAAESLVK